MENDYNISQVSHVEIPVPDSDVVEPLPDDNNVDVVGSIFDDFFADPMMTWTFPSYGECFLSEEDFGIFNEHEMYGTV